jgi:hypothetical protein
VTSISWVNQVAIRKEREASQRVSFFAHFNPAPERAFQNGDAGEDGLAILGHAEKRTFCDAIRTDDVIAVVGKLLSRLQARELSDTPSPSTTTHCEPPSLTTHFRPLIVTVSEESL